MTKGPEEAIELLHSLPKYDVKPGLERIEFLLAQLGDPDRNTPTLHIAGSNGKGSVVAMLSGVLSRNHRIGKFVSPPLKEFSDRIVVESSPIDRSSILEGVRKLKKPIRELRRRGDEPSFFEATTALAAWYFNNEEIDLALVETGLGGRYDATNPLGKHVLSAVTSVDPEHQNLLGDSIEEIARELAGIAKPSRPLVIGPLNNCPRDIFRRECMEKGCKTIYSEDKTELELRDFDWANSKFEIIRSPISRLEGKTLEIGLAGTYQRKNLGTALTILGELANTEFAVGIDEIETGLKDANWPGRFQLLERNPHFLVDGAHNEAAANLLSEELRKYLTLRPREAKVLLVFSGLKDKDLKGMLAALGPVADKIYLTELEMTRAAPLKALERRADKLDLTYRGVSSPQKAIKIAKRAAKPDDLICVTGSLYLVREAMGNEQSR